MKRLELVAYWATKPGVIIGEVKRRLPEPIRNELMSGSPTADFGIYVDAHNEKIERLLDTHFGIGKSKDFVKDRVLETSKEDIQNCTHFFIKPLMLDSGKDVLFDLTKPTCSEDSCPWGGKRSSPITIGHPGKLLPKLGIARISRIWDFQTVELVLSLQTKDLFDKHEITGLEYEACYLPDTRGTAQPIESPPAYLARIVPATYQCGKDIVLGVNYCKIHSIVLAPTILGLWTPREAIKDMDFQRIETIKIDEKEYYCYKSLWIVSRRVLELLLNQNIPGLERATTFLDERFRPLLIRD